MQEFHTIDILDPALEPLASKVSDGLRLSVEDGLVLESTQDFHTVCALANMVNKRMHGNRVGYIVNVHVDYTNVCVSRCRFCAFYRTPDSPDAYVLTLEEVISRIPEGVDEVHLVGGINPDLDIGYFTGLVGAVHEKFPGAVIKAFTAVEIHALCERSGVSYADAFRDLKDSGLGMLPGGGAEIFNKVIRRRICPNKATAEQWLEVHRVAHGLGIPSNSTMLHGHIESPEDRIDHLDRLRRLQDETSGFVAHIPLPWLPGGSELSAGTVPSTGILDLRQIAIARLMLDNIPHIKAYWRALGIRLAQIGLRSGADDIDGTIGREDVMHEAGSDAPGFLEPERLKSIIEEAGMEPYRRDALHQPIEEDHVCLKD